MPYADPEVAKRKAAERYLKNRDKVRAKQKEYNDKNKTKNIERAKAYAKDNKEKIAERQKGYRDEGRYDDKRAGYAKKHYDNGGKDRQSEWQEQNRDKTFQNRKKYKTTEKGKAARRSWRNTRRKREKHATPSWVKMADIQKFYLMAQQQEQITGLKYHVDHIIPISHDKVSGLNVPANLRVVPAEENLQKTNKFEPFATYHN